MTAPVAPEPRRLTPTDRPTYAVTCRDCEGTGRHATRKASPCSRCEGYGTVLSYSPITDVDE